MNNIELFYNKYLELLSENYAKNPHLYWWKKDQIESVARTMTMGLVEGNANISEVIKQAAKDLGVKPNIKSIREFLNNK